MTPLETLVVAVLAEALKFGLITLAALLFVGALAVADFLSSRHYAAERAAIAGWWRERLRWRTPPAGQQLPEAWEPRPADHLRTWRNR